MIIAARSARLLLLALLLCEPFIIFFDQQLVLGKKLLGRRLQHLLACFGRQLSPDVFHHVLQLGQVGWANFVGSATLVAFAGRFVGRFLPLARLRLGLLDLLSLGGLLV